MKVNLSVVFGCSLRYPLLKDAPGKGPHKNDTHIAGFGFVEDALFFVGIAGVLKEQVILNLHDVEGVRRNEATDGAGDALRCKADIAHEAVSLQRL